MACACSAMEFTTSTGKGYVPAERNRPDDAPIGFIPVDSLYSPVRKVSYRVENTREGQILDYDKLTMTAGDSCARRRRSSKSGAFTICDTIVTSR